MKGKNFKRLIVFPPLYALFNPISIFILGGYFNINDSSLFYFVFAIFFVEKTA